MGLRSRVCVAWCMWAAFSVWRSFYFRRLDQNNERRVVSGPFCVAQLSKPLRRLLLCVQNAFRQAPPAKLKIHNGIVCQPADIENQEVHWASIVVFFFLFLNKLKLFFSCCAPFLCFLFAWLVAFDGMYPLPHCTEKHTYIRVRLAETCGLLQFRKFLTPSNGTKMD